MFYSKEIISFSQNYQDVFALLCNDYKPGKFVDIGCSYPDHFSNVITLIHNGWSGIGFDLKPNLKQEWNIYSNFINVDQLNVVDNIDIVNSQIETLPETIDYLNVDIDGYPCQFAIENINHTKHKFKCITIEHDAYRFGDVFKEAQRTKLLSLGYKIVVTTAAEDWYINPSLISQNATNILNAIPHPHLIVDANTHLLRKFLQFKGIHQGMYTDLPYED